ncbi:MAG: hypothetical protein PHR53_09645 [Bacteroidales bacterium]|nr:hypothetical protein [Bacteroidales bacterium]
MKEKRPDQLWLNETMRKLDCTLDEALDIWAEDNAIDRGEKTDFDLTPEQQKNVKQYIKAKKPPCYSMENAAKKRAPRKPNDEKRDIINKISGSMYSFHQYDEGTPAEFVENIEIVNAEREITFTIGENEYSLTLTCHRKPKK